MNLLINLAPLKKGGGQNVALNFLEALRHVDCDGIQLIFLAAKDSEIFRVLKKKGYEVVAMPGNPFLRIVKEWLTSRRIIDKYRINIIYSYFGTGLFPKKIPQVSGCADSNLFFPEIDFWIEYSGRKKLYRKLIDNYRLWGLKRSYAVVFENEIMQKRSAELFHLPKTAFIRPSIKHSPDTVTYRLPEATSSGKYRGLFLCGWQRNKNFMIIPQLASFLKNEDIDFHFVITAPRDGSADHLDFVRSLEKYHIADRVSIVGAVQKAEIGSLYAQIDFVFLLSKLESFSNNIIEAWYYKKPLVIADELWSRSICGNGAIYVPRNDVPGIVNGIKPFLENESLKNEITDEGSRILSEYPTAEERTRQEIDYIKTLYARS